MLRIVSSAMRIVPDEENAIIKTRTTPFRPRLNANETTNDGTPALVTITPIVNPMAVVIARATSTAMGHGHPGSSGLSKRVMTTPPTAELNAIARSISASSKTKTTPMAMVAKGAICSRRLVKFRPLKYRLSSVPKIRTMTTRPMMIGRNPRSPERTRTHQAEMYSPTVFASFCSREIGGSSSST